MTATTIPGVDLATMSGADLRAFIAEAEAMKALAVEATHALQAEQQAALRDAVEGVVHYAVENTEYADYGQNGNIWAGYKLGPVQFKVGDVTYTVSVTVTDLKRKKENEVAKAEREAAKD